MHSKFQFIDLKGRERLGDRCVNERIILRIHLKRVRCEGLGVDSCGSSYCALMGSCEDGDEHLYSIKGENFFITFSRKYFYMDLITKYVRGQK
jgi:hypothetical protein